MNAPNPAIVTQRAAQRLPRAALMLLCAAYVLPGLFGRDPWKNADIAAFGYMREIALGLTDPLAPTMAGLPPDGGVLPYWLGALFLTVFDAPLGPALAARLPFALLMVAVLSLTWYACYHLARTEAAQPVALAFGGEASPVDYARVIADGAVLALIACLGLLQLGHETTPELLQLAGASLFLYGMAASVFRGTKPVLAVLGALPMLAASGAPSIAVALGLVGITVCALSRYGQVRRFSVWIALACALAVAAGIALDAWAWRLDTDRGFRDGLRLLAWFTWPAWPLVVWTLWRWRFHLADRHIAVPLGVAVVSMAASLLMGGSDRALLLGLPGLATLAAFALPTLRRSVAAAIDWFALFFFSGCAMIIWVVWLSMQTGIPAKPAANVAKLAPGFQPSFSAIALGFALAGTVAWILLVRWRAGRHPVAIWKSMVLPAGGVALCWLLLMTLWLPLLDYARSYRALVQRVQLHVPPGACVETRAMSRGQLAALQYFGNYRIANPGQRCAYLLLADRIGSNHRLLVSPQEWHWVAGERRPADKDELTHIYKRVQP